jgi:excisionase family DNA binding protein
MGTPRAFDDYPPVRDSAQVAELLGYKVNRIRLLAQEGRIPAHRDAGARSWWFDRDELIEWMRSETKVTPAAE